jgi:hypothetical protein
LEGLRVHALHTSLHLLQPIATTKMKRGAKRGSALGVVVEVALLNGVRTMSIRSAVSLLNGTEVPAEMSARARATLVQHASAHHGAPPFPFSTGASRDVGAAAAVGRARRVVDVLRRPELRAGRAAALDEPRRGGSDLVDPIAPSAGRPRRD